MSKAFPAGISWPVQHHYYCVACGWISPQADFPVEPEKCPRCGANPDGSNPWPEGTYDYPERGWTCFHCGETFTNSIEAGRHFGRNQSAEPACRIKGAKEQGLVIALRAAEAELDRYRKEDSDKDREMGRMQSDHDVALRREEERGYEKGLRDERARSLRIIARVKVGLRNGGARNACDEIVAYLNEGADA